MEDEETKSYLPVQNQQPTYAQAERETVSNKNKYDEIFRFNHSLLLILISAFHKQRTKYSPKTILLSLHMIY
jgi:hypothetical protein